MKTTQVTVRFPTGLHARTAASLVQLCKRFRSRIVFRLGNRIASASSILSILLLAATFSSQLEVQASGEDEEAAIRAAEVFFQSADEEAARQVQTEFFPDKGPAPSSES